MFPKQQLKKRSIFLLHLVFPLLLLAQNRITGKVIGENNKPLSDASIQIKGSNQGAVSDTDGKFSVMARSADILVVSHTGFLPKEVTAGTRSYMEITHSASNI